MRPVFGIAATLHDAAALAGAFGPGAELAIGAPGADILAPAGPFLTPAESLAAIPLARGAYFLAFGNAAPAPPELLAPLIETLTAATGTGFMAICLAAPWAGRTVFQGHMFEHGRHLGDGAKTLAAALGQPVAKIAHQTLRGGALAVRRACTAAKEQGRIAALVDCIDDDDAAIIAEAFAGMALTGGGAWALESPHAPDPTPPAGRLAILSGALDRATNLQIGALRGVCEVFDLSFTTADPAAEALAFATNQPGPVVISAAAGPDRVTQGAPAALVLGEVARGLRTMGFTRFIVTGGETGQAVAAALGVTTLTAGAPMQTLRWLHGAGATFCFKPAGFGPKNLFLSEVEPQIRLNAEAKSHS